MGLRGYDDLDLTGSGAKVLTIRAPGPSKSGPEPTGPPSADGISHVVVEFAIDGRPIPWSAPTVTRVGKPFKKAPLVAWQRTVRQLATQAMRGRSPHFGPVELEVTFFLARRPGSSPDLVNLTKALEDALQGPVIANDRQVYRHRTRRVVAERNGASVRVLALEIP